MLNTAIVSELAGVSEGCASGWINDGNTVSILGTQRLILYVCYSSFSVYPPTRKFRNSNLAPRDSTALTWSVVAPIDNVRLRMETAESRS
jgi:hypothetical protein